MHLDTQYPNSSKLSDSAAFINFRRYILLRFHTNTHVITHIPHYSNFIRAYSSLGLGMTTCSLPSSSLLLITAASSRVKNILRFLRSRVFITRVFLTKIRSQQAIWFEDLRIVAHFLKIFRFSLNLPLSARENFIDFAILKSGSSLISSSSFVFGCLSLANYFIWPILDLNKCTILRASICSAYCILSAPLLNSL